VDYTTLTEELIRSKELESVGGVTYLSSLTDGLPRAVNAEHYARIVHDKAILRQMIHAGSALQEEAADPAARVDELLERAQSSVLAIGRESGRGPATVAQVFERRFGNLDKLIDHSKSITGLVTGFREFDRLTCGLQPSELIIVAARPSMGKTAWALDIARHIAAAGKTVLFFSLEMSEASLLVRLLCGEGHINGHKLRHGWLRREELVAIPDVWARISQWHMLIDDTGGSSLTQIRAKALRQKQTALDLIIIDYLQLMSAPKAANMNQEVNMLTRGLKALAKELAVPVVVLSQLSRGPDNRTDDHRPKLSDLRDSGGIEQDADLVAFLFREEYYLKMQGREVPADVAGKAEIIVAKQRNGPTDKLPLIFLADYSTFVDPA